MVRIAIIGIVIAAAFTLYALVDAAMADAARARGVSKPVWVVLVVVLPVIGAALWFTIGKGRDGDVPVRETAPEDDPRFTGTQLSPDELDLHMRELEDRLRELDEEVFPGEPDEGGGPGEPDPPAPGPDGGDRAPGADDHRAPDSDEPRATRP